VTLPSSRESRELSVPKRRGPFVIDTFFVWAAYNSLRHHDGHDPSRLNKGEHFFGNAGIRSIGGRGQRRALAIDLSRTTGSSRWRAACPCRLARPCYSEKSIIAGSTIVAPPTPQVSTGNIAIDRSTGRRNAKTATELPEHSSPYGRGAVISIVGLERVTAATRARSSANGSSSWQRAT
jgi:hypothetical protein